jgi:hypothetical protein
LSPRRVDALGILDSKAVTASLGRFLDSGRDTSAAGIWFLLQLQRWGSRWLAPPREEAAPVQRVASAC